MEGDIGPIPGIWEDILQTIPKISLVLEERCLSFIYSVFSINIEHTPLICMLGYVEDLTVDSEEKIAIARILFMARKVIAFHWLDNNPPTIQERINTVNWLISLERGIYLKRGAPHKYEEIWAKWLYTPVLASPTLTRHKTIGLPY